MGIELNATLNSFVEWAQRENVGNDSLVHATALPSGNGAMKVTISDNRNDGIGFFAWCRRSSDTKDMNNATRKLFQTAVMDMFDAKTINDVPKSVRDQMKLGDYGKGRPLSARRILAVVKAIDLAKGQATGKATGKMDMPVPESKPIDLGKVQVTGTAISKMNKLVSEFQAYTAKTNPGEDYAEVFREKLNKSAKSDVITNITSHMDKIKDPDAPDSLDETMKDIKRTVTITLNGQTKLDRKSTREELRDSMLRFVTGNKDLTWENATRQQKYQTQILISLCNQSTMSIKRTALSDALDTDPDNGSLNYVPLEAPGGDGYPVRMDYSLSRDDEGNITIRLDGMTHMMGVTIRSDDGDMELIDPQTSTTEIKLTINMPKATLDKLGNADWGKYDNSKIDKMVYDGKDSTAIRQKAADIVGDEFKFDGSVDCEIKVHFDVMPEGADDDD